MSRLDTLEEKIRKLIDRSFVGVNNNVTSGIQISQDLFQRQMEELIAFMQYFQDRKLYITDNPISVIPHPDGARRLVDPNLRNTPSNITLSVNSRSFEDSYTFVERINELMDSENEVFLYSLDYVTIYDPINFEPSYRILARYAVIDLIYWYTPIEVPNNGNNLYIPNNDLTFDINGGNISENESTLKIINTVLRHKFNGNT